MDYIIIDGVTIPEEEITKRPWYKRPIFPILGLSGAKICYFLLVRHYREGKRFFEGMMASDALDFILRNPVTDEARQIAKERGYR